MTYVVLVCFILCFIWYKNSQWDRISIQLLFMYLSYWLLSLLIASFGVYGFPVPRVETYMLQFLHILFFIIGFSKVKMPIGVNNGIVSLESKLSNALSSKLLQGTIIVFAVYSLSLVAIYMQQIVIAETLHDVRNMYYEGNLYGNLFAVIKGPLLEPINMVLTAFLSFSLFKKKSIYTYIALVAVLAYNTLNGGRFGYVLLFFNILMGLIVFFDYKEYKIKYLSIILVSMALLVSGLVLVSSARVIGFGRGTQAWKEGVEILEEHATTYTSAPNVAFEYAIYNHYEDKIGGFQYGALTLSSIENIFAVISGKLGYHYVRPLGKLTEITQLEYINIKDNRWNALYTSSLYYYLDFGICGLMLFPFIFGYIYRYSIKLLYLYHNMPAYILLSAVFTKVMFSVNMFGATDMFFFLFIVLLYVLAQRKLQKKYRQW